MNVIDAILKMIGTDWSPRGIRNPLHIRSTSSARMTVMAIRRTIPKTGELARSGSDSGVNMLSYIKTDITFSE
jgi:hypothetical protein